MAPNVGLDASVDNMLNWKGTGKKAEEDKREKVEEVMDFPAAFSMGVAPRQIRETVKNHRDMKPCRCFSLHIDYR
jgi:hypothetical protein